MVRIKIQDLPPDHKISKEEMRQVLGGVSSFNHIVRFRRQLFSRSFGSLSPQPEPPD